MTSLTKALKPSISSKQKIYSFGQVVDEGSFLISPGDVITIVTLNPTNTQPCRDVRDMISGNITNEWVVNSNIFQFLIAARIGGFPSSIIKVNTTLPSGNFHSYNCGDLVNHGWVPGAEALLQLGIGDIRDTETIVITIDNSAGAVGNTFDWWYSMLPIGALGQFNDPKWTPVTYEAIYSSVDSSLIDEDSDLRVLDNEIRMQTSEGHILSRADSIDNVGNTEMKISNFTPDLIRCGQTLRANYLMRTAVTLTNDPAWVNRDTPS